MAIDKINPKALSSDAEERIVRSGDMLDALNVTISNDGDGSLGVLKNMVGDRQVDYIGPNTQYVFGQQSQIIGAVKDENNDRVFFFLKRTNNTASRAGEGIYVYYTGDDVTQAEGWREVLINTGNDASDSSGKIFTWNTTNRISADVITADFRRDGTETTLLFFTSDDPSQQPYCINVDTALEGGYDSGDLAYMIRAVKAAPNESPSVFFDEDPNVSSNNFQKDVFQFTCQYLYRDGQESALGPYSSLVVPFPVYTQELSEVNNTSRQSNVAVLNLPWGSEFAEAHADVEAIRVFGRIGNTGNFLLLDEFPADENKTRNIGGNDVQVFSFETGEYRFYNDGVYSVLENTEVDKLYDNVPLSASTQKVIGNRLIYGNYTEGRPNSETRANILVEYNTPLNNYSLYSDAVGYAVVLLPQSSYNGVSQIDRFENGELEIDLLGSGIQWPNGNTYNSEVPPYTSIRISFEYKPKGTFHAADSNWLGEFRLSTSEGGGNFTVRYGRDEFTDPVYIGDPVDDGSIFLTLSYFTEKVMTVREIAVAMANNLKYSDKKATLRSYFYNPTGGPMAMEVSQSDNAGYAEGGNFVPLGGELSYVYAFDDLDGPGSTNAKIYLRPYPKKVIGHYFLDFDAGEAETITYTVESNTYLQTPTEASDLDIDYLITQADYGGNLTIYLDSPELSILQSGAGPCFKAGSLHDFGVVYYDKYNRSGNVNKIGSAYVKHQSERSASQSKGPASISVDFNPYFPPPSWADRWQLVYSGSSYSNVQSFLTNRAFPVRNADGTLNTADKRIFVGIQNLDEQIKDRPNTQDYSFTEGDILRVISYDTNTSGAGITTGFPSGEGQDIIEFNVLGVTTLADDDENPIMGNTAGSAKNSRIGRFLILENQNINGGLQYDSNSDGTPDTDVKFLGWDWPSISGEDWVNDSNAGGALNHWGKTSLVEILTPRASSGESVYYEIGTSTKINFDAPLQIGPWGGTFSTSEGDVHCRLRECLASLEKDSSGNWLDEGWYDFENFTRVEEQIESPKPTDTFPAMWSRGRAHVPFEKAATVSRGSSVVFSDSYVSGETKNSLSAFYPNKANYYDFDLDKGTVQEIVEQGDSLFVFQEGGVSATPVNKYAVSFADTSENLTVSDKFLASTLYVSEDYGCRTFPESVISIKDSLFFVDPLMAKVVQLDGRSMKLISDKGNKSRFDEFFSERDRRNKFPTCYDPRSGMMFVTRGRSNQYSDTSPDLFECLGYHVDSGFWQSKYSYVPMRGVDINNKMVTFWLAQYPSLRQPVHVRDYTDQYNSFANGSADSSITVISNAAFSSPNVFNSISVDSNSGSWTCGAGGLQTNLGSSGRIRSWSEKEGVYYSSLGRNEAESAHSLIPLGELAVDTAASLVSKLEFTSRVNNLPIARGMKLAVDVGGTLTELTNVIASWGKENINFGAAVNEAVFPLTAGTKVYAVVDDEVNGDPLRGNWLKIKLDNNSSSKWELYSIGIDYEKSLYHHE